MYSGVCPCGGALKESSHAVKTLKAAQKWFPLMKETDLPVLIIQKTCVACGRLDKAWRRVEYFIPSGYWEREGDVVRFVQDQP